MNPQQAQDEVDKVIEHICDLSSYGQELHPNDFKNSIYNIISQTEERVRAEERERIVSVLKSWGKDWGSGASEKLFNEILQTLTKTNHE